MATILFHIGKKNLQGEKEKEGGVNQTITPKARQWDHAKVIIFIKCKKQEHVNFKCLVDLHSQTLSAT
jgi:hypothetical protein